jgi:Fic family protein
MDPADFSPGAPGHFVATHDGFQAFVPGPLPPAIDFTPQLVDRLAEAANAVGLLAGTARNLANPMLLIAPYLRREAVLSSRIEGTVSTLADLYEDEATGTPQREGKREDVREVRNYVAAHEHGLMRLQELPLSMRLLREVHGKLMAGVRGQGRHPGEFRSYQNWIARNPRAPISEAYVPPPIPEMKQALKDLESFLNREDLNPLLIAALSHYQFEAIHPFGDGNGRIGRLMISLLLHARGMLPQPLLNLSAYFERTRTDYYDGLLRVSMHGDWAGWLDYFLEGMALEAQESIADAERLVDLQTEYHEKLSKSRGAARQLVDHLFINPYISAKRASEALGVTDPTARSAINDLVKNGILTEVTGRKWGQLFLAEEVLDAVQGGTEANAPA